jgi:hypothetical protein
VAEGFFTLDTLYPPYLLEAAIRLCLESQRGSTLHCTQENASHVEYSVEPKIAIGTGMNGQAHCHGAFAASIFYYCGYLQCIILWTCFSTCKWECSGVYVHGCCMCTMVVLKIYLYISHTDTNFVFNLNCLVYK